MNRSDRSGDVNSSLVSVGTERTDSGCHIENSFADKMIWIEKKIAAIFLKGGLTTPRDQAAAHV
ncbi:MAG TPA: hypothetical protein VFQ78_05240 [Candidatus Udaeobacter sp.]|jgi:hypothetical protein|nr:hypothetical protein [Candidatus Udaeobacter sp.]